MVSLGDVFNKATRQADPPRPEVLAKPGFATTGSRNICRTVEKKRGQGVSVHSSHRYADICHNDRPWRNPRHPCQLRRRLPQPHGRG